MTKSKDMKKIFLLSVLLLIFLCTASICIFFAIKDEIYAFVIPIIISTIGVIATSYLLVVEAIFGHRVYHYSEGVLHIKRKEKTVLEIPKSGVRSLTLIHDVDTDNLYLISFEYNGKKHYIEVNSKNNDNILKFVEGIDHTKRKNYWYYIIYLLEVLLVC